MATYSATDPRFVPTNQEYVTDAVQKWNEDKIKIATTGSSSRGFVDNLTDTIRTEAPVLRYFMQEAPLTAGGYDPNYNPFQDPDISRKYHPWMGEARNKEHAMALIRDLEKDEEARLHLEQAPFIQTVVPSLMTQVLDPFNLAVNYVTFGGGIALRGGIGVARSAIAKNVIKEVAKRTGYNVAEGMTSQALQETALQLQPTTKSYGESVTDVLGAGVGAGVLGGAFNTALGASVLGKSFSKDADGLGVYFVNGALNATRSVDAQAAAFKNATKAVDEVSTMIKGLDETPVTTLATTTPVTHTDVINNQIAKLTQGAPERMNLASWAMGPVGQLASSVGGTARALSSVIGSTFDAIGDRVKKISFNDLQAFSVNHLANAMEKVDDLAATAKKAGSRMSPQEFRALISDLVETKGVVPADFLTRFGDDVGFKYAKQAAQNVEKFFNIGKDNFNRLNVPWAKEAIDNYTPHFIRDLTPEERIRLETDIASWFRAKNPLMTELDARAKAGETTAKLMNDTKNELLQREINPSVNSFKQRVLDVPYEIMRPYYERDISKLMSFYNHTTLKKQNLLIALRENGFVDELGQPLSLGGARDVMQKEYNAAIEAARLAGDNKAVKQLTKEMHKSLRSVDRVADEIFGATDLTMTGAITHSLSRLAAMSHLPLSVFANFQEAAALVAVDGFAPIIRHTLDSIPFTSVRKMGREHLLDLGAAADIRAHGYMNSLSTINESHWVEGLNVDELGNFVGKTTAGIDKVSDVFMKATGAPTLAKEISYAAVSIGERKMVRLLRLAEENGFDSLPAADKQWLLSVGIDSNKAARVVEMMDTHPKDLGGHEVFDLHNWTDKEIARDVEIGLTREATAIRQTARVGETPELLRKIADSKYLPQLVFAYMRFIPHSWNNMVLRNLQRGPATTFKVMTSTLALATLAQYTRDAVTGVDRDAEDFTYAVARNYGPLTIPMMVYGTGKYFWDTATGNDYQQITTLNRTTPAALSWGQQVLSLTGKGLGAALSEDVEWKGKDTYKLLRNIPILGGFLNLPYTTTLTRKFGDYANATFGKDTWEDVQDDYKQYKEKKRLQEAMKPSTDVVKKIQRGVNNLLPKGE